MARFIDADKLLPFDNSTMGYFQILNVPAEDVVQKSVLEDIKSEIEEIPELELDDGDGGCVEFIYKKRVINIIDKHISGKE